MSVKAICFIGHRNVELDDDKVEKLKTIIENLIIKDNAQIFLFGSRSDFDYVCHKIVTELKEKYPHIQRRCYIAEVKLAHWKANENIGKMYIVLFIKEKFICLESKKKLSLRISGLLTRQVMLKKIRQ